jgi:hypothetical protein
VTEGATGNPLGDLLHGALSEYGFGVLKHGFAPHGRDYRFVIQDSLCGDPGTCELVFTHVVDLKYETRVGNTVWQTSGTDEFTDFAKWKGSGEPEGYVFGTDWSLAYPGIKTSASSREAQDWSERLQHPMYSARACYEVCTKIGAYAVSRIYPLWINGKQGKSRLFERRVG